MRLTWKEKVGSFIRFQDAEPTIEEINGLMKKSNQAVLLTDMRSSDAFVHAYLPLMNERRDALVAKICNLSQKDKHNETAIRLDELDGLFKIMGEAIEEGQKAQRELELLHESRKETA